MKAYDLKLTQELGGDTFLTVRLDRDSRREAMAVFDDLSMVDIDVTVKKYRKGRSLDANSMCWALCTEIARKTGVTKEEVYRRNIREGNEYTALPIHADAVEDFSRIWAGHGVGWFVDVIDDSKLDGYKKVFAYHGSSTYDTKAMSDLIDRLTQDARAVGINILTERERALLLEDWGKKDE